MEINACRNAHLVSTLPLLITPTIFVFTAMRIARPASVSQLTNALLVSRATRRIKPDASMNAPSTNMKTSSVIVRSVMNYVRDAGVQPSSNA